MNKVNINGEADNYIETLIDSGTPHTLTYTNNSVKVETKNAVVSFSGVELTPFELGFIGMAKNEVRKKSEEYKLRMCNVEFFYLYKQRSGFYDVTEVDISSAYWETAYRVGLLSKRIYETGNSVSKDARLIAFGAAATVKRVFEFDGQNYYACSESSCRWGRAAYFQVAKIVTSTLRGICSEIPGRAYGWWVDAIFVDSLYCDYVKKRLFEEGYFFKEKRMVSAEYLETEAGQRVWKMEEPDGRKKEIKQCFSGKNDEKKVFSLLKDFF